MNAEAKLVPTPHDENSKRQEKQQREKRKEPILQEKLEWMKIIQTKNLWKNPLIKGRENSHDLNLIRTDEAVAVATTRKTDPKLELMRQRDSLESMKPNHSTQETTTTATGTEITARVQPCR